MSLRLRRVSAAATAAALTGTLPVVAHHSPAKFAPDRMVELQGEIVEVDWRNPHVVFTLRGNAEGQEEQIWRLESQTPNNLRRVGITQEMVAIGDNVIVAGMSAVNGSAEALALNMLLPDGRELLFVGPPTRFDGRQVGDWDSLLITDGDSSRPELGLFRVWSSTLSTLRDGLFRRSPMDYPLTDAARESVMNFDPIAASERLANDCTPKGMPWIMQTPYDIAFERNGNDVLLKLEESDIVRRVHMGYSGDRSTQPYSIHGFSTGSWDRDTLVVETTNLSASNFLAEIPTTDRATLMESFTPSPQGDRLEYTITVTDPGVFTEPVTMKQAWLSLLDQAFDAYNCGQPLSE
jgi:hypothetical protein